MKRVVIGLMLVGILALTACAGQANTVESLTQQALDWLLGDEAPAQVAPTAALLATPTLAPTVRATQSRATATREPVPTAAVPTATTVAPTATTAAPTATRPAVGVFEGEFAGDAYGSNDTTAPIALVLTHRNDEVAGTVTIGNGLRVSAGGLCGNIPVPATVFAVQTLLPAQDRRLETRQTLNVQGFDIEVALVATLSNDGQSLTAQATLFTPALCSRDPAIDAVLTRQ